MAAESGAPARGAGLVQAAAARIAEAGPQVVLAHAPRAAVRQLPARHGDEDPLRPLDDFQVANDEGVVEGDGAEREQPLVVLLAQLDADFRDDHRGPPSCRRSCVLEVNGADVMPAVREVLPVPCDQQALQQRVAELTMQPLDRGHPLWQFHLVEDYDGGSALIARIHHCIADGIALIHVMMGLVDGGEAALGQRPGRTDHSEGEDSSGGPQTWLADSLVKPLTQLATRALDAAGDGVAMSLDMVTHPGQGIDRTLQTTLGVARMGGQVLRDMGALALMPDDSPTSLKGRPHAHKAVAWCDPISLDEVKAVGRVLGCSVNDVLLSCVAGALGAYLQQRGESVAGKEIRAMVPVNLRPLDEAWKLGNRFGLVPLVLPIGIAHPIERVYAVRQRMQALKGSTQPLLAFGLLSVAGLLVKPAQEAMLGLFSRKTTAVMTNVPGPSQKLAFCGATLEQTMFWVPQSGDIGVGVSILSYGGGVQFGLITDTGMCAQPQLVIDQFAPQFASLSWLSLMLPWGEEALG